MTRRSRNYWRKPNARLACFSAQRVLGSGTVIFRYEEKCSTVDGYEMSQVTVRNPMNFCALLTRLRSRRELDIAWLRRQEDAHRRARVDDVDRC